MTCFETRLNCFDNEDKDSFAQKMIDANATIFALSLILKFNVPWFKMFPKMSKTWRALVEAEDFFFGYVCYVYVFTVKLWLYFFIAF